MRIRKICLIVSVKANKTKCQTQCELRSQYSRIILIIPIEIILGKVSVGVFLTMYVRRPDNISVYQKFSYNKIFFDFSCENVIEKSNWK